MKEVIYTFGSFFVYIVGLIFLVMFFGASKRDILFLMDIKNCQQPSIGNKILIQKNNGIKDLNNKKDKIYYSSIDSYIEDNYIDTGNLGKLYNEHNNNNNNLKKGYINLDKMIFDMSNLISLKGFARNLMPNSSFKMCEDILKVINDYNAVSTDCFLYIKINHDDVRIFCYIKAVHGFTNLKCERLPIVEDYSIYLIRYMFFGKA